MYCPPLDPTVGISTYESPKPHRRVRAYVTATETAALTRVLTTAGKVAVDPPTVIAPDSLSRVTARPAPADQAQRRENRW